MRAKRPIVNPIIKAILAAAILIAAWAFIARLLAPSVEVAAVTRGTAVQAVYATGTVEATVMMPIAPRVGARMMELLADEGQAVAKGQVLAQMEDADKQKSVEELRARVEFAERESGRKDALARNNHVSQSEADQARTEWQADAAALARAEAEAAYLKLLAPADGLVIKRDGEVGQLIPADQPVFWLSCCAPLRISSEVDEEDVPKVKPGQDVLIRADAFPSEIFHGIVQSITPKGDPVARSYRVRIGFVGEVKLQIGMTAETNIMISEHKDALLVPASALSGTKLWLSQGGVLAEQKVSVGARGQEQTEILSGVNEGDMVVVKPSDALKAGERIRPRLVTPKGE